MDLKSDDVLKHVAPGLKKLGFDVESSKHRDGKISVPVLLGEQGAVEKSFEADAFHPGSSRDDGFVLEVEAGRGFVNNQFLKDLFQACVMQDVAYLAIAVRQDYRGSNNYESILRYFETLYASDRLVLPLRALLLIGY